MGNLVGETQVDIYSKRDNMMANYFEDKDYHGGIRRFRELPLDMIMELDSIGVVDIGMHQNYSPTLEHFIDIMKDYPHITLHGYVYSKDRGCYPYICPEGIDADGGVLNGDDLIVFNQVMLENYRAADVFTLDIRSGGFYCWWD